MAKKLRTITPVQKGPIIEPKGERAFADQHKVTVTADREGNDDEVFKGTNVKTFDRAKHRYGVPPDNNIPTKKIDFVMDDTDLQKNNPNSTRVESEDFTDEDTGRVSWTDLSEEEQNAALHEAICEVNQEEITEGKDGQETIKQVPGKKKSGKANGSTGVDNTVAKQVNIVSAPGYQKNWRKDIFGEGEEFLTESHYMFSHHSSEAVACNEKAMNATHSADSCKDAKMKGHYQELATHYKTASHHHLKLAASFARQAGIKEEEQLDEIGNTPKGRKMLSRYIAASDDDVAHNSIKSALGTRKEKTIANKVIKKRTTGINRAVDRGGQIPNHMKEEQLDEKDWIAGAIKHPGAEKRAAKRAGMSTHAYMEKEKDAPGKAGERARLGLTLSKMNK